MNEELLDLFPSLLLVSDLRSGSIDYCNKDALKFLGSSREDMAGSNVSSIISRASLIFFESYVRPSLLDTGRFSELQMTLVTAQQERLPVLANVTLHGEQLYWSMHSAKSRDKLYQELIEVRDSLELKTDELTLLSRLDPLTNLLNRRAASADTRKLLDQVNRKFVPVSFLLIDIDFFKNINDKHGHDVGDEVIVLLSKTLKSATRKTDVVARWGGEEFLIVLYNSTQDNARLYCKYLHERIAELRYSRADRITVSIGVTQIPMSQHDTVLQVETLIKEADDALYQAKGDGRNRTIFHTDKHAKI